MLYHALHATTGDFLAEVDREVESGVCEIVTLDDSAFVIAERLPEIRNEVAAFLGIDDEDVYLTDEDESEIIY